MNLSEVDKITAALYKSEFASTLIGGEEYVLIENIELVDRVRYRADAIVPERGYVSAEDRRVKLYEVDWYINMPSVFLDDDEIIYSTNFTMIYCDWKNPKVYLIDELLVQFDDDPRILRTWDIRNEDFDAPEFKLEYFREGSYGVTDEGTGQIITHRA